MKTTNAVFPPRIARRALPAFALGAFVALTSVYYPVHVYAEAGGSAQALAPGAMLEIPEPSLRGIDKMQQTEASFALPASVAEIPFRPTIDMGLYKNKKAARLNLAPGGAGRPGASQAPQLLAPPGVFQSFSALNQTESGGLRPPDPHAAVGKSHVCQVVNTRVACYNKAAPNTRVLSLSLASFFGYTLQTIFDPRIAYDGTWNRWVVSGEAFPESTTVQRQFLAVSTTDNPLGTWYIYNIDVNVFNNDDFWDYPQLGMDQDAVILTANVFGPTAYRETRMFAIAKARLYNGLGWNVPLWTGLVGTLAPPIVLDQNANAYLVAAPTGGTTVWKYTLQNASNAFNQTLLTSTITVPAYTVPPDAQQPGTAATLDTLDARFVNASGQVGDSLFQTHTTGDFGLPTPRWYEFDTEGAGANTIKQSGSFWAAGASNDFNASIMINASRNVVVSWSSTDPGAGINAQVRLGGKQVTDTATTFFGPGLVAANCPSPSSYSGFRWGDYSSVALDPLNANRMWVTNERIINTATWGTCIAETGW